MQTAQKEQWILKYDSNPSVIKLARYKGEVRTAVVVRGCVSVGTQSYYVSNNLPNGSVISINIVNTRNRDIVKPILVRDVLKFGNSSLEAVAFRSRHELLDLLGTSFSEEYGFHLFGGRCIAPHVFVAIPITFSLAYKCSDERLDGVTLYSSDGLVVAEEVQIDALPDPEDDVDGVCNWPPVENEQERVQGYQNMVRSCIRKMSGKWKDVYLKRHVPGQLPFDSEDLLQQGLMEVTIAIRKYNSKHQSQAKESTFVYRHLWNRFGQIAHKYSKTSRGYGVGIVRDFIDDSGNLVPSYEISHDDQDEE
jgi:hypothetical protein